MYLPKSLPGYAFLCIFLSVTILQVICIFGYSASLLNDAVYDIKIDTRDASVNDILGGIKINSSLSEHTKAETYLQDIKDTFNDLSNGEVDYSVARAFSINDFVDHGINAFSCWSNNRDIDGIRQLRSSNLCSMNGFLACLGFSRVGSSYSSGAYNISTQYLRGATKLSEQTINDLSSKWSTVVSQAENGTLFVNISDGALEKMAKLSCSSDIVRRRKWDWRHRSYQKRATVPWAVGLTAILIQFGCLLVSMRVSPYTATSIAMGVQIVAMSLWIVAFAYNQSLINAMTKRLEESTEGLKIKGTLYNSAGNGVFFIVVLILQIFMLVVYVTMLWWHDHQDRVWDPSTGPKSFKVYLPGGRSYTSPLTVGRSSPVEEEGEASIQGVQNIPVHTVQNVQSVQKAPIVDTRPEVEKPQVEKPWVQSPTGFQGQYGTEEVSDDEIWSPIGDAISDELFEAHNQRVYARLRAKQGYQGAASNAASNAASKDTSGNWVSSLFGVKKG